MARIKTKYKHYDVLLVGAGLFNAVLAQRLSENGKRVLVVDRRDHIGGNCYTRNDNGIEVHQYGAHIFHTSDVEVWDYVNKFVYFKPYINSPIAIASSSMPSTADCPYGSNSGETEHAYNMPFNMNTFARIFASGFTSAYTPDEVTRIIKAERKPYLKKTYNNLEERALGTVGPTIYNLLIKGYTEKQWGKPCSELPPEIIGRIPLRMTYDNNYFNDTYQGIPADGSYTKFIEKLFANDQRNEYASMAGGYVEIKLGVDFNKNIKRLMAKADHIYYSGAVDELMNYEFGPLGRRSLRFVEHKYKTSNSKQGTAVFNYTSHLHSYTRTIEHKFFSPNKNQRGTIVSYEYPVKWTYSKDPYYPVNNDWNNALHIKYCTAAVKKYGNNIHFVGRLGSYRYMDMDDTIRAALNVKFPEELECF